MKTETKNLLKSLVLDFGPIAGIIAIIALLLMQTGCASPGQSVAASASGKNLNLDGFLTLGSIETANPDTATPQGKFLIGRASYRSRKVGIPSDQKVPTTGYFKATQTENLFGMKETIIEWDFTAGSDADAKAAQEALKAKQAAAEKSFAAAEKEDKETKTEAITPTAD